jgi:hypothetical protein
VCLLYCSRSPESSHMIPVRSGMYCASHLKLEFFRLSESFDSSMDLCICCSLYSSSEMRCCIQSIVAAFKASNLRSTKKSSSDAIHLLNAWYPSVLYGCFFGSLIAGPVVLPGPGKLDIGTGGVYCAPDIIEGWWLRREVLHLMRDQHASSGPRAQLHANCGLKAEHCPTRSLVQGARAINLHLFCCLAGTDWKFKVHDTQPSPLFLHLSI